MPGLVARGDPTFRRDPRWDLGAGKVGKGQRWSAGEADFQGQKRRRGLARS